MFLERIRLATPTMRKIWENSALVRQGCDQRLSSLLEFEGRLREMLKNGKIMLEDIVPQTEE